MNFNLLAQTGQRALEQKERLLLSDGKLAELALRGDKQAYEVLVRRYQKLVYNIIYQMCKEKEMTADLTQESFLRAYRALTSFDQSASFKPWLVRIATNLCLNALRDAKNYSSLEAMLEAQPDQEPAAPTNIELEVELKITKQSLFKAIDQLPVRHRYIFLLRYQHDLSYAEIALVLKQSESAVKAQLFRIREYLRKDLLKDLASENRS